ncbi:Myb-like protein X [Hirschfeldia incana]|nr:Myb-like protein X [Hirschfeldia incana]
MSRCFPFPPPGYDKKITTHESDPLIKENYKEKKQRNDKDKEKKEGKEKKSRDRSKDKHKERKEKRKDKEKDKEKCKPLGEQKAEVLPNTGNREKLATSTVQNNSNGESKYVQELARRIRYDEEATGSQSAQKITNQKGMPGPIQETNDKRISTQKNFAVAKSSEENAFARESFGADQKRPEAMGKPMENRDQARHTESPERGQRKESAAMSDKPRDKEVVKKHGAKDRDRRNKEEKTESINKSHQSKLEKRQKDSLDIRNGRPPDISQASVKNLIAERGLGKRMDLDTNGLLSENGTKPNKLQRHSASVSSVENGRTLGPHRSPLIPASEVQETTCKPEVQEVKVNGFAVSGEKEKVCSLSPLTAAMRVNAKENGEASAKPPHPDLKYLDQILSVPKRELFMDVDNDEEWLYVPLGVKLKKARTYSPDSGESFQVWNQAFKIESADVFALPYVVPF